MTMPMTVAEGLALTERGGAASFKTVSGSELLVDGHEEIATFAINLLDSGSEYHFFTSDDATMVSELQPSGDGSREYRFTDVGVEGLTVTTRVRFSSDSRATYWTLSCDLPEGFRVADIHFPYLVVPNRYEGLDGTKLVVPMREGVLIDSPRPGDLEVDHPTSWRFDKKQYVFDFYPGTTCAQFLAYYADDRGLYVACEDTSGAVKEIKPVDTSNGIRLGIAHIVGWNTPGVHELGYDVQVSSFEGDWTVAADRYRAWYDEAFKPIKLVDRRDVPAWLLDSPLHVILRAQGELDSGPARPNPEVVPFSNALSHLDKISDVIEADVLPIVMSWEGPGPWVYPESFPAAGGDAAVQAFSEGLRRRGWHLGTYCNGTQWVTQHKWTGYDGSAFYRDNGGDAAVCRLPKGEPWKNPWDQDWRTSYTSCVVAKPTRDLAKGFVEHLIELGFDWIQFLDQNCSAAAFPCYSPEHGHPPVPGVWMTRGMDNLLGEFEALARGRGKEIAFSVEGPPNDYALGRFSICDTRPDLGTGSRTIPLYKYLHHEHILTESAFAPGPNPYWMQVKTAVSFAEGDMITATMGRNGRLVNWSGSYSSPWARWDEPAGDQNAIFELLRQAVAMRKGVARDFVIYGRLLATDVLEEVDLISWTEGIHAEAIHAIKSAHWRAQDGREAIALANWTTEPRTATLPALEPGARAYGCEVGERRDDPRTFVTVPPLTTGLIIL